MTTERIAEIEKMLAGYEAWRERWYGVSGFRITMPPAEIAIRELLADVKGELFAPPIQLKKV